MRNATPKNFQNSLKDWLIASQTGFVFVDLLKLYFPKAQPLVTLLEGKLLHSGSCSPDRLFEPVCSLCCRKTRRYR